VLLAQADRGCHAALSRSIVLRVVIIFRQPRIKAVVLGQHAAGAGAQQATVPVIGFLGPGSGQSDASRVTGFRQGLSEAGLVEGRNFTIEYRWADSHYDRLPALATELVRRQVAVIATSSTPAVLAAKATTTTIPIVFETASNPVKLGLVGKFKPTGRQHHGRDPSGH
jgi:ABC-type uncharacterized transport system substrate-binding protein